MSATTSPAAPPPGRTLRDRIGAPNPIWMRELRQSARLGRTPWILLALTITIALFLCAIGGIASSDHVNPARVGSVLFQAFFSIAYMVVVIVGPAVAANGIAAEREGRTWEAVLLAGLDARALTRGKFLAAYTTIALYIVTLAPVGALSFLFGGVTATEVVTAFGFLFLLAGLAVAFGLAVSSLMESLRGALVTTLALAVMVGPFLYFVLGVGGCQVIHENWPDVEREAPIWLPLALTRADFGVRYAMILLLVPTIAILVPGQFLYTVTVANLTSETDDRSTGLKRWYVFSTPAILALAFVPMVLVAAHHRGEMTIICECALFTLTLFAAFLFAREPLGPSRRVRVMWERQRVGAIARFFGPGLPRTMALVVVVSLGTLAATGLFGGYLVSNLSFAEGKQTHILFVTSYACAFLLFVVGFVAALRARGSSVLVTRIVTFGVLFLIAAVPWVAAAIGGALSSSGEREWLMIAAPSPFYAFYMMDQVREYATGIPIPMNRIFAGFAAEGMWTVVGLGLFLYARGRTAALLDAHDKAVARAEEALRAEDEALAAANANAVHEADAAPSDNADASVTSPASGASVVAPSDASDASDANAEHAGAPQPASDAPSDDDGGRS